ncbi:MAG: YhbY family RNA-binding protein [Planctomycetes bacterium]|nr:YhbY family RNA-binding protein [Planctomycetota bacterium]
MNAPLSKAQMAFLRGKAHSLGPLLSLGKQGLNPGFVETLGREIAKHELLKVRVGKHVDVDAQELAASVQATLVQQVGRMVVLYRPAAEPVLELPPQ